VAGGEKGKVVIIKKGGGHHGGHHGGAWKVAYADFVTAMMAFFIVMWLLNQSEEVRAGVAGYFREPVALTGNSRSGILQGGKGALEPDFQQTPSQERIDHQEEDEAQTRARLQASMQALLDKLEQMPGADELMELVEVELTEEGLKVQLMEGVGSTFFESGVAALSPDGRAVLVQIARVIGPMGCQVVIEGHTDSRPFPSDSYTNWELSADRANAARKVLVENGVASALVSEIRGHAERQLRFPENPEDPRNRRVSIMALSPARDVRRPNRPEKGPAGGAVPAPAEPAHPTKTATATSSGCT
jgi:chemotaxis protein MotB